MRIYLYLFLIVLTSVSCKKTEYSPEGPTDIRIHNLTDIDFNNVIVKSSEYDEDTDTIELIQQFSTSAYHRFRKAYPKIIVSADIQINGNAERFSTGEVDFRFMQYLGTQRVTFNLFISSFDNRKLDIDGLIPEEELILK